MFAREMFQARLVLDRLNLRERYLILITASALVFGLAQGILILTGLDKHDDVIARIDQQKAITTQYQQAVTDLEIAINNPTILALQSSNKDFAQRIENWDSRINNITEMLITPDRMIKLLEELLADESKILITSFQVMPIETIKSDDETSELFYQHSISMDLEGEFEVFVKYLEKIEALPWQLFWDDLSISTESFPKLKIHMEVHTLSQDEEWLNV